MRLGAAKAKAQFLSVIDAVANKREPVTVTRNGKALVRIVPMPIMDKDPIFGFYQGKLVIVGDIVSPIYTEEELEEFEARSLEQLDGTIGVK